MLREVKIHDSALLPKVQFNPGRKGRAGGRQRGRRRRTGRFFFFFYDSPYLELKIRVILH